MKFKKEHYVNFAEEKVIGYPHSKQKLALSIKEFNIRHLKDDTMQQTHSSFISPYGIQFSMAANYIEGDLLKVEIVLPGYWQRKSYYINYTRVNTPSSFAAIVKVVHKQPEGSQRKKNIFVVEILSMDSIDEQVLKSYLEEGGKGKMYVSSRKAS